MLCIPALIIALIFVHMWLVVKLGRDAVAEPAAGA